MSEDQAPLKVEIIATMRDVTVTYDGYLTRALSRVTLDARRGEVMGVLGAKGAGKSTVLKALAGRLRPAEGAVKVFDRSPRSGATKARVGYLPGKVDPKNSPGFLGRVFGGRKESPSGRGVARLTQAILGNRDFLILDDPFVGLEPAELIEAKTLIRGMIAKGKTVVLSSDSLMDVKDICQRMAIFDEGKLQAIGTLAELLAGSGAVRFLPPLLPRDMMDRVVTVLREEILGGSTSVQKMVPSVRKAVSTPPSTASREKAAVGASAGDLLTVLAKPAEAAPVKLQKVPAKDLIDHGKLEDLVKRPKPN
jgi:ABC-2 type transport system ATP-binding protein